MKTLIVEDDLTSRFYLQSVLSQYGECRIAVNGREAIEAFLMAIREGAPYDLVCMDIMMPDMDGLEALQEIRKIEEDEWGYVYPKGVKVIMTTALDDSKNIISSFKSLCDLYMVKPIEEDELVNKIKQLKLLD